MIGPIRSRNDQILLEVFEVRVQKHAQRKKHTTLPSCKVVTYFFDFLFWKKKKMNLKNKPKIDYDMQLKKIKGLSAQALIKWIRRVGLISFF